MSAPDEGGRFLKPAADSWNYIGVEVTPSDDGDPDVRVFNWHEPPRVPEQTRWERLWRRLLRRPSHDPRWNTVSALPLPLDCDDGRGHR